MAVSRAVRRAWPGSLRVIAVLFLIAAVSAPIPLVPSRAQAHNNRYGWTDCHWAWREVLQNPNIRVRDNGSFPPDTIRDGVMNSFDERIDVALGEWNKALANTGLGLGTRYQRVGSSEFAHVTLEYENLPLPADVLAVTSHTNHTSADCPTHGTSDDRISSAKIEFDVRGDWFTQRHDRRALWEACPTNNFQPAYTCSKTVDFGAVATHELGHIFILDHPDRVDCHIDDTNFPNCNHRFVWNLADCKNPANGLDQATMCPQEHIYRTERRTYHAWDLESLKQHYQEHLP